MLIDILNILNVFVFDYILEREVCLKFGNFQNGFFEIKNFKKIEEFYSQDNFHLPEHV